MRMNQINEDTTDCVSMFEVLGTNKDYTYYKVDTYYQSKYNMYNFLLLYIKGHLESLLSDRHDPLDIHESLCSILDTMFEDGTITYFKIKDGVPDGMVMLISGYNLHQGDVKGTYVNFNINGGYTPFIRTIIRDIKSQGYKLELTRYVNGGYFSKVI